MDSLQQDIPEVVLEVFTHLCEEERLLNAEFNLTLFQLWILLHLDTQHGHTLEILAGLTFGDTIRMTRLIEVLEAKGLVIYRQTRSGDQCPLHIFITEQGQEIRKSFLALHGDTNLPDIPIKMDQGDLTEIHQVIGAFFQAVSSY